MGQLSELDLLILQLLRYDARLTYKEIADKTGKSLSSVHDRIRKLEHSGYILGYRAELNKALLGKSLTCFIMVRVKEHARHKLESFMQQVIKLPEVEECFQLTGEFDFILKIATDNMNGYQQFLQKVTGIPGIHTVQSHIVLSASQGK